MTCPSSYGIYNVLLYQLGSLLVPNEEAIESVDLILG